MSHKTSVKYQCQDANPLNPFKVCVSAMNLERSSASSTLGAQTEKSLSAVQETWV